MAGKFKIFQDNITQQSYEPNDKVTRPVTTSSGGISSTTHDDITTTTNTTSTITATASTTHASTGISAAAAAIAVAALAQPAHKLPLAESSTTAQQRNHKLIQNHLKTQQHHQQQQSFNIQQQHPSKREPLGLRQPVTFSRQVCATSSSSTSSSQILNELPTSSAATNASNTITSSTAPLAEEDQENDISMASLGSDFMPSICNGEYDDQTSSDIEEDFPYSEADSITGLPDNGAELTADEDFLYDEDDDDLDDALKLELDQAFRQHEDSQLFKSSVYIDDIELYLIQLESNVDLKPLPNYMDYQTDLDSSKRATLVKWLVEVADEFELQTETLFICVSFVDRFLSLMSLATDKFQLLGVTAMFIASKYEEIYPPYLHRFVEVTDDTYSGHQILQMEQEILKTLNFRISTPTISYFLRRIFAYNKFSKKVYHLAEYLCYLSLLIDKPVLEYHPSEIAVAAVILAAHQLDAVNNISSELKNAFCKSNQAQLDRRTLPRGLSVCHIDRRAYILDQDLPLCIESLRNLQQRAYERKLGDEVDSAIYARYSADEHGNVTQLAPPQVEDLLAYL